MKKKLTVNRLAMGNLRARRKQYTLMIIGIILAMIFSSGVLFFVFCMASSLDEMEKRGGGNQDAVVMNAQFIDFDSAVENGLIKEYALAHAVGYGYTQEAGDKKGSLMAWYDEGAQELAYYAAKEGRLPESAGEIAAEKDALVRMKLDAKVGDKITLTVKTPDGEKYLPGETEKTYTLVGILYDKRANLEPDMNIGEQVDYPALMVSRYETVEAGGRERLVAFVNFKSDDFNGKWNAKDAFMDEIKDKVAEDVYSNMIILTLSKASSIALSNSAYNVMFAGVMAAILTGVLLIASCVAIVNTFSTNLQERKKQIGLLRAVGATRRQIISLFGREALIISFICTPVSTLVSYFAVKLVIGFMGDDFLFIPHWWVLILCAVFGVVCVMAAAFIPLFRASKISPLQAIRNVELSRRMKNKCVSSQKQFSAPKLLAKRNLMFYKGKRVGVSIILIATIVISGFGFSFVKMMDKENNLFQSRSDYSVLSNGGSSGSQYFNCKWGVYYSDFGENVKQEILSIPYVSSVKGIKSCMANIVLDGEYSDYLKYYDLSWYSSRYETPIDEIDTVYSSFDEYVKAKTARENDKYVKLKNEQYYGREFFPMMIHSLESDYFKSKEIDKYVIEGKIDIDKLNSGEEIILYAPDYYIVNRNENVVNKYGISFTPTVEEAEKIEKKMQRSYHAGDEVELSTLTSNVPYTEYEDLTIPDDIEEISRRKVKIGAVVSRLPDECMWRGVMDFCTTNEGLELFYPNHPYLNLDISLKSDCDQEIDDEMTRVLNQYTSGQSYRVYSRYRSNKEDERTVKTLLTALISIVILFFSVCASIINNSLTAQIRESKREFGTLRAVGASAKELTGAYITQFLSMFGLGCGAGFGLYTVIWLVAKGVCKSLDVSMNLSYEVWQAAAACAVLFLICSLNLYFKIKKQMRYSIVENIREL